MKRASLQYSKGKLTTTPSKVLYKSNRPIPDITWIKRKEKEGNCNQSFDLNINLMKRSISIISALSSVSALETFGEELKIWRLSDRFSLYSFNFEFEVESPTNVLDFMPV